ncbi:MAG: YqeG family HAD IIIA-type phosphatase [Erysipelotrichaceae bacterium]|nr:YqeG family HAD IIIA-type phosphatase [Erysipelotrichaceae bacterium]
MNLFRPKQILPIFTDFDAVNYKKQGFDTVFLDIDNTIAIPDTGTCDERAEKFIKDLRKCGFQVLIFSNNNRKRVRMFLRDIDAEIWFWAGKPLPFAYWLACLKMKTRPSRTIVMGDQLLTDILGANLSGCYGIYCKQLQEQDTPTTARNRKIERMIWKRILHEEV